MASGRRFRRLLGALVGAGLSLAAGPLAAEPGAGALKAAFIHNFALYTEWPGALQFHEVCVAGRDDLGEAAESLGQRLVAGRALTVRRLPGNGRNDVPETCTILFVAASEGTRAARWFDGIRTRPVLTVGDAGLPGSPLAMLQLSIIEGKLGFVARPAQAQAVGLRFSAKMLRVARAVESAGE